MHHRLHKPTSTQLWYKGAMALLMRWKDANHTTIYSK